MSSPTGPFVNTIITPEGLAKITFYHPAHNSMPGEQLTRLAQAISEAGSNKEVKLILLESAGDRTFCAGASFDELMAIEDAASGLTFFSGFASVINAMRTCGTIVIGRVQGKAVGGGIGLAAATDYCIATKWASVKLSELALGIGPFVIGPAVERKVGLSAFSQMALNAKEWQTAQWAKEKGLFTDVFESVTKMDEYIEHFTQVLLSYNPEALQELKQVFWEGTDHWDYLLQQRAALSGRLVLSQFTKDFIEAFKNKA